MIDAAQACLGRQQVLVDRVEGDEVVVHASRRKGYNGLRFGLRDKDQEEKEQKTDNDKGNVPDLFVE